MQNYGNHHAYHPEVVVFGIELRLPCYNIYLRKCPKEEDVDLFGRIILKLIYENCGLFIGYNWLRIKSNFGCWLKVNLPVH
jgi:hypothetical protein